MPGLATAPRDLAIMGCRNADKGVSIRDDLSPGAWSGGALATDPRGYRSSSAQSHSWHLYPVTNSVTLGM